MRRTNGNSGGVIHAAGASQVARRAGSSYPNKKPRSGHPTSKASTLRIGGGDNRIAKFDINR